MTKDFKIADTATSSQYGISWVLGGIAVGLLAGAVVYALMSPKTATVAAATASTSPTLSNSTGTAGSSASSSLQDKPALAADNRPGFSYHAVLPQLEMSVPLTVHEDNPEGDAGKATTAEEKKPANKSVEATAKTEATPQPAVEKVPANAQGKVMYQLGAYKSEAQANQIQRLASQKGLNTRVEATDIKGERWYRVRLGPTNDANTATRWKQMLSGMGISAMEIRL
ncbi:MAG TPA: SPOR domain-containing protein [Thiolinea sp.]|nr:SPOR domain-containing protein [Thiolinea sp.]